MPRKSKIEINGDKRDEMKMKLLEILEITEDKSYFTLNEIDSNEEMKKRILELEKDCQKYFTTGSWTYFINKKKGKINDRSYLTFLRNIMNECNIGYINKQTSTIKDGKVIYMTKYMII